MKPPCHYLQKSIAAERETHSAAMLIAKTLIFDPSKTRASAALAAAAPVGKGFQRNFKR